MSACGLSIMKQPHSALGTRKPWSQYPDWRLCYLLNIQFNIFQYPMKSEASGMIVSIKLIQAEYKHWKSHLGSCNVSATKRQHKGDQDDCWYLMQETASCQGGSSWITEFLFRYGWGQASENQSQTFQMARGWMPVLREETSSQSKRQ